MYGKIIKKKFGIVSNLTTIYNYAEQMSNELTVTDNV